MTTLDELLKLPREEADELIRTLPVEEISKLLPEAIERVHKELDELRKQWGIL